jgi:excisionase family DNA binding protein
MTDDLALLLQEQNRLLKKILDRLTIQSRAALTTAAAAKVLGVRHSDVLAWVAEGRLRTMDMDGKERVPRTEIDRLQNGGLPEKPVRKRAANGGPSLRDFKP